MADENTRAHEDFWSALESSDASHITELMAAERAGRSERAHEAFAAGARSGAEGAHVHEFGLDEHLFDLMWLGDNIRAVNAELRSDLANDLERTKAHKDDPSVSPAYGLYNLTRNARLISFFHAFGAESRIHPGRLEPETERMLVDLLWWRTMEKNDISNARTSTWWIAGSENHDLNTKVTNLLTSAIFAADQEYANRVYPDYGRGCAPGYMTAGFNPDARENSTLRGCERAAWADAHDYRAREHERAWTTFLTKYLAERARRGFFLENGSPSYMRYTVGYLLLLYNFCPDPALKAQTGTFLDLFWTDWALQSIGGLRGGPKTRHHHDAGVYDACSTWARFYLGGPGTTQALHTQQLIGDYEFAPHHWDLVLDREELGSFAYLSRGIGEEEQTCPRPFGAERTMIGNVESRMVKYAYVTPDYVLGTQMDHPLAVHNHLSASGRWQGLVTRDVNSRVCTVSLEKFPGKTREGNDYSVELMYHSAQHRQVLVTQQRRRWTQINPDWFPAYEHMIDIPFGLYVGTGWETRHERDGWVFLQQDGTYVAIRVIRLKSDPDPMAFAKGTDRYALTVELEDESYSWNESRTVMRLTNRYSPIIIEAGRMADHGSLAAFEERVLANRLEIHKTVATSETRVIVAYTGIEADEIVFNAANPIDVPTIGGTYIDFSHPKTFDAPYLQSEYGSGVVEYRRGSEQIVMDLSEPTMANPRGLHRG